MITYRICGFCLFFLLLDLYDYISYCILYIYIYIYIYICTMGGFRHGPMMTASALFSRCVASRLASSIYCMYRSRTGQQRRDRVGHICPLFVYTRLITNSTRIYRLRYGIACLTVKLFYAGNEINARITCRSIQRGSIWSR